MKVLITGASGLLGTYLVKAFDKAGDEVASGYNRNRTPELIRPVHIDLNSMITYETILRLNPDVIIHCAGITDVDYCEKYPHAAMVINVSGTVAINKAAEECGARLVFISSNDVFDDAQPGKSWTENDRPTQPANIYGNSKLMAEQSLRGDFLIVRTTFHGWCYNNPSHSISHKIINALRAGEQVYMARDQYSSLMYAGDLAKTIVRLVHNWPNYKVVHLASSYATSRYVFAQMIAQVFRLDNKLIVPTFYRDIVERNGLIAKRPMRAIISSVNYKGNAPALEDGVEHMMEDELECLTEA